MRDSQLKSFLLSIYDFMWEKWMGTRDIVSKKLYGTPSVMSIDDTISAIIQQNLSVCRYGDGEFKLITGNDIRLQSYSDALSHRLIDILYDDTPNCLVCISDIFDKIDWMIPSSQRYSRNIIWRNRRKWTKYLNLKNVMVMLLFLVAILIGQIKVNPAIGLTI